MGIKICGHRVRVAKPIKLYTLLKAPSLVLVIGALWAMPANAADTPRSDKQASSCVAASCPLLQEKDMTAAPATKNTPQHRTQRTAGSHSISPAMALAMAFGMRNVQGPVEHRDQVLVRSGSPVAVKKQMSLLSGEGGQKRKSMNAAGIRLALEN